MKSTGPNYQVYLNLLDELSSNLSSDPTHNIELIVKYTHKILGGVCSLYNKLNKRNMSLISWAKENTPLDLPYADDARGHICYEAAIKGHDSIVCIDDIAKTAYQESDPYVKRYNLRSYLGSPVKVDNQSLGSLCIVDTSVRQFSNDELLLIRHLANLVRIEEEKQKIDKTQNLLYKISRSLLSSSNIAELSSQIHKHLEEIMTIDRFLLLHYDPEDGSLKFAHPNGLQPLDNTTPDYYLTPLVMQSGQPVIVNSSGLDQRVPAGFPKDLTFHSWMGVPLKIDHQIIGIICMQTNGHFSYIDDDKEILEFISYEIAHVLKEKKLEEELKLKELDYRTVFEQSTVGLYRTDFMGNILMANQALIHMLEYDNFADLATVKLNNSYAPEYQRRSFLEKLRQEKFVTLNEVLWKTKTQKSIFVNETAQLLTLRGRQIIEGTVVNVTDKVRSKNAYEFEKQKFNALSENISLGIIQFDSAHSTIFLNERFRELTGFGKEDIQTLDDFYHRLEIHQRITVSAGKPDGEEIGPFFIITLKNGKKKHVKLIVTNEVDHKYMILLEDIEHLVETRDRLAVQSHYLSALNEISHLLINNNHIPYDNILKIMGQTLKIPHCLFLEIKRANLSLYTRRIACWNDNANHIEDGGMKYKFNLTKNFPNWSTRMDSHSYITGMTRELFEPEKSFLKNLGVESIFIHAIKDNEKIIGALVLETDEKNRSWQDHEIIFVRTIAANIEKVTESVHMKKILENSKSSYMELFKKSSSGIIIFNENSFIENINPAAQEFFNKTFGIVGKTVDNLCEDKKVMEVLLNSIQYCNTEGKPKTADIALQSREKNRYLELHFSRIKYFDKSCVIMYAHDITERHEKEQLIRENLQEKQTLLQEVHHRVKNNLQIISSLLNMQLRDIESEKDRQLFIDSQNRIKSIALIHESLYHTGNLSRINFRHYTEKLISRLLTIFHFDSSKITCRIEVPDIEFDLKKAIPCGLVLDELITNSLKYAFPEGRRGEISIVLKRLEKNLRLEVRDNGVGLDPSNIFQNTHSLGFELMTTLVQQLKGSYRLLDSDGFGVEITFPE
ncbi:MAG: GAF domain-containing protein [Candidatus Marinimicrobia bacterium]|nr:GAF domain-containing protein [Candidatus Neomarinimicrobiota bacterium]